MFITRTKYEKEIIKAEKRGERREREKINVEHSFDALNKNMWNQFDKINTNIDTLMNRIIEIESKLKNTRNERKTIE